MSDVVASMSAREAILTRDAIRWFVEDQRQRRKELPPDWDMREIAEQFDRERLAVADQIDEELRKGGHVR